MKNTFIITNSFTGYRHEINCRGEFPALRTIKRHLRAAKARDCVSATMIHEEATGDRYVLMEPVQGETVLVRAD